MKIRAITVGAPLVASAVGPVDRAAVRRAGEIASCVGEALAIAGWEVQTVRLATPPLETVLGVGGPADSAGLVGSSGLAEQPGGAPERRANQALSVARVLEVAQGLEAAARDAGFGYVSLGAVNTLATPPTTWQALLAAIPEVIAGTEGVFCSASVATHGQGINVAATRACGDLVHRVAGQSGDGFGNLRFAAVANCPPHIPFFPAAYHDGRSGLTLGLALQAADLAVEAFGGATNLENAEQRLETALTHEAGRLASVVARALASIPSESGAPAARLTGIDLSLAPFPAEQDSIGAAFERLGLPAFGASGTLFCAALLTNVLRRVEARLVELGHLTPPTPLPADPAYEAGAVDGSRCLGPSFGFSGLMLPVLEDSVLAQRAAEGTFGVDSLLLYSSVCGLGLDTVPVPGDTPPGELGAIILDMAALAVRLDKPLTARLFPVPGKRAGDPVSWDFAFFAPSRVLPVRGLAPTGLLAAADHAWGATMPGPAGNT